MFMNNFGVGIQFAALGTRAYEGARSRGLGHELGVRHLDSDGSLQLVVLGQVDEAEAALAQQLLDPVAADALRDWGRASSNSSPGPHTSL